MCNRCWPRLVNSNLLIFIKLKEKNFQGIGKALALRLAQLGAQVVAVSKSDDNLKQLVAEVRTKYSDLLISMFFLLFGIQ